MVHELYRLLRLLDDRSDATAACKYALRVAGYRDPSTTKLYGEREYSS